MLLYSYNYDLTAGLFENLCVCTKKSINLLIHLFIYSFIHLFIVPFIHLFIHSLIQLFLQSYQFILKTISNINSNPPHLNKLHSILLFLSLRVPEQWSSASGVQDSLAGGSWRHPDSSDTGRTE